MTAMRKRLLLADDSITIQRVIELTFADEPIDVEAVSDGAAAIARLDASPPDILLADIGMPARDGYEVALHVRRTPRLSHIPVMLLTGAFDPIDHTRAREAGCAGVLVKPFDPQMLIARVRQLLDAPSAAPTGATHVVGQPEVPNDPVPGTSTIGPSADPEEYFARLDRAFAALGAPSVDSGNPGAASRTLAPAPLPVAPAVNTAETRTTDLADGTTSTDSSGELIEPRADTAPSARPTLGDAFAALLTLEQGWAVPDLSRLAGELFPPELLDHVAARVSRAIAERVVREVAPAIVTELAERLVREELARLQLERPTQYDRRS
jgi:CheY-like chemotaxis protein